MKRESVSILVCDDDPDILKMTARALQGAGYEVTQASSGSACRDLANRMHPDLVLLDVVLPDTTGDKLCAELKAGTGPHIPFVVLASGQRTGSEEQVKGLEAGADGYIARPVSNRELIARVDAFARLAAAEKALRRSEQRLIAAGKAAYDLIYEWDPGTDRLEWFGDIDGILGYRKGQISRDISAWLELIHPDDQPVLQKAVEHHRTSSEPILFEYRVRHADGRYRHWKDHALPLFGTRDPSDRWIGVCSDITTQRAAEEALRSEQVFTDAALDAQVDTFFVFEPRLGKAVRWNKAFSQVSGYSDAEIASLPAPESYYSPDDLEKAQAFTRDVLARGVGTIELDLICKNGRTVPTEYRVSVLPDEDGDPKYLISVGRDISERRAWETSQKTAQQELKELTEQLQRRVEQLKDAQVATLNMMQDATSARERAEKTAHDLERFNRMAVGRETRMIELKRRINELMALQGQEPPYRIHDPDLVEDTPREAFLETDTISTDAPPSEERTDPS